MKLDLEHLGSTQPALDIVLDRALDTALFENLRIDGSLLLQANVYEVGEGILRFEGILRGAQLLTCARSLEIFSHPFEIDIQFEVHRDNTVRVQELEDEDADLFLFRIPALQESVDIAECVRQLVLLQEPMHPVKNPTEDFTWRDSTVENSVNSPAAVDPRWEKLKEWKQTLDKPQ